MERTTNMKMTFLSLFGCLSRMVIFRKVTYLDVDKIYFFKLKGVIKMQKLHPFEVMTGMSTVIM